MFAVSLSLSRRFVGTAIDISYTPSPTLLLCRLIRWVNPLSMSPPLKGRAHVISRRYNYGRAGASRETEAKFPSRFSPAMRSRGGARERPAKNNGKSVRACTFGRGAGSKEAADKNRRFARERNVKLSPGRVAAVCSVTSVSSSREFHAHPLCATFSNCDPVIRHRTSSRGRRGKAERLIINA